MKSGALTASLCEFVLGARDGDFPPEARERARDALIDCMGCMLLGSRDTLAGMLLRVLPHFPPDGAAGRARLIGTEWEAALADAALFNGTIAHAQDFDDTNHPGYAHPSAVLAPVLLALGPPAGRDGAALITAYIVGLEVIGKLGRALNTPHYQRGWHPTVTFGTLAAVAVAGRLLGLSREQLAMGVGVAGSAAGGLRASFGTMTKPLHAGYAARNGVLAALLAREGFTADADVLAHPFGFAQVFNGGEGIDPAPLRSWGSPLEILSEFGLALKPYPSCGATHPGIEAALLLHGELAGRTADLRAVRVGVPELALQPLIHENPATPLQAKFSIQFCVAAALAQGAVTLETFTPQGLASPAIRSLLPRVWREVDPRVRDDPEFATIVTVETADGSTRSREVPLALGKPSRWFTPERLRAKFFDCGRGVLPQERLEAVYASLAALDGQPSLEAVLRALMPDC